MPMTTWGETSVTEPDPTSGQKSTTGSSVLNYFYDRDGNVIEETDNSGNTIHFYYDPVADRLISEGPTRTATIRRILTMGQAIWTSVTSPDPANGSDDNGSPVTSYAYDALGRCTSMTTPAPHVAGRQPRQQGDTPAMPMTTWATCSATDALGNITSYVYNARNECVEPDRPRRHHTFSPTTWRATCSA